MEFRLVFIVVIFGDFVKTQERTILDEAFSPLFRWGREIYYLFVQPRPFEKAFTINVKNNKVQQQFTNDTRFFCDVDGPGARSKTVPESVHMLRPGDIDIVGAIGDSLTAGASIFALNVLQILLEGRGSSWAIGGQRTWRNFLTLPNILKEFNPNLYGYSVTDQGTAYDRTARFNVAETAAMARDTMHQARNLVKRMRSDPNVNMKDHWKLVTYMIGGNDFCLDICYYQSVDEVLEQNRNSLISALRILRANLPRTMVNVVLPPDVSILNDMTDKPYECVTYHYWYCPCFFSPSHYDKRQKLLNLIRRWQQDVEQVIKMPEFHDQNDFEVTFHPFLDRNVLPRDDEGNIEYKYISVDCFHMSQVGHARAASTYWNSMLSPENQRRDLWKDREFENFRCPTQQNPYLLTTKNS